MGTLLLVLVAIAVAAAVAAVAIGCIAAFATAVGNKQWWWVAGMVVFAPVALLYCLFNRQLAQWPSKLLFRGCAALAVATLLFLAGRAFLANNPLPTPAAMHSTLPFPPSPKARANLSPGATYAIDGGDSFIYYGQVAVNKQMAFFHFRSQALAVQEALSSRFMSRFGVQYASVGAALRSGAWQFLGRFPWAAELEEEPVLVQWPVGTLEVTLWKGASVLGTTQVHDPAIQDLEVIAAHDAIHHVPQRLREDFSGHDDQGWVGGSVLRHRLQKQALAARHPDQPWHALPAQWVAV